MKKDNLAELSLLSESINKSSLLYCSWKWGWTGPGQSGRSLRPGPSPAPGPPPQNQQEPRLPHTTRIPPHPLHPLHPLARQPGLRRRPSFPAPRATPILPHRQQGGWRTDQMFRETIFDRESKLSKLCLVLVNLFDLYRMQRKHWFLIFANT